MFRVGRGKVGSRAAIFISAEHRVVRVPESLGPGVEASLDAGSVWLPQEDLAAQRVEAGEHGHTDSAEGGRGFERVAVMEEGLERGDELLLGVVNRGSAHEPARGDFGLGPRERVAGSCPRWTGLHEHPLLDRTPEAIEVGEHDVRSSGDMVGIGASMHELLCGQQ